MSNLQIDCCETIKPAVAATLSSVFTPTMVEDAKNAVDALYGTRKTRYGSAPDAEAHSFMTALVNRYAAVGSPLKMIGMWGAVKAYGLCNDRCGIDVYDAMAIHRLDSVCNDVKRFFPLGAEVMIVSEDVTEQVLGSATGTELQHRIESYQNNLIRYTESHSENVRVVTETQLINALGKSVGDFLALGESLTEYLFAYWVASSQTPESEWEGLSEYKALQGQGWNGIIPTMMREHYLNRCGSEYPHWNESQRIRSVCRYFGNALARYKMGMMGSGIEDHNGKLPPIKSGFGTLGPGVSKAMLKGRVDYKIKASKGNTSTPPWCGWGMLTKSKDCLEPTIVGVRNGSPTTCNRVEVTSNGVKYRADVYAAA